MSLPVRGTPATSRLLLGESQVMLDLRAEIAAAARSSAKVLIVGETGVGKELVARSIHLESRRAGQAFVAVNCSGIPDTLLASELFGHRRGSFTGAYRDKVGLVRQAHRGTLFLDELGEMSLAMQAALLRFAETGEIQPVGADHPVAQIDVRLIAATNRDLRAQVAAGQFREDLYYRLNVIPIRVPPLRDRGGDILLLVRHYLAQAAAAHGIAAPALTPEAAEALLRYSWPGNVRELRNVAERLVLRDLHGRVTPDDLPAEIHAGGTACAPPPAPAAAHAAPDPAADDEAPEAAPSPVVDRMWERLVAGEDFWAVAHRPFRDREVTRADLAALVDRGLQHTRGSYRALVRLFNLAPSDYKRFHAFLYQQNCNLPVAPYRSSLRIRSIPGRVARGSARSLARLPA
ncbi:MAG TPA: sigma 54-interacting transcriptional regulator [Vicinamibacterales bacterium]|nr:sigma 54-interacting transcriptional regulator [Vicinamibacterales bacterium]